MSNLNKKPHLFNLTIVLFIFSITYGFAQFGFSNEIGVIAGPLEFRSDYGARNDESTNFGNTGFGLGIIHYINFAYRSDCSCYTKFSYFNDHFKVRSEISWNKTTLNHFGEWVASSRTGEDANRLRAQEGVAQNIDVGMQIEFYPLSIRSFQATMSDLAPFVSVGAHFTSFNPEVSTTYGDGNIQNANNFHSLWEPGSINPDSGTTWSVVTSVGIRYKLTALSDLMIDLRWQYYFNDWIDGLNHQLASNKHNDRLLWLNFGYIYYLD